jgi:hypothetical protein
VFLPCIGSITHWATVAKMKPETIYLNHTFQKQSSLTQFEIVTSNGRLKLSIPTIKNSRKGLYKDVKIDYSENWQIELWRSIEYAYLKSPFFIYYDYKLKPVILATPSHLVDYNLAIATELYALLKLDTQLAVDHQTPIYFEEQIPKHGTAYPQVFDTKQPFETNLCILDLIFNLGPEAKDYLLRL